MPFLRHFPGWARQDSNLGPTDYESAALTTELRARDATLAQEARTFFHSTFTPEG